MCLKAWLKSKVVFIVNIYSPTTVHKLIMILKIRLNWHKSWFKQLARFCPIKNWSKFSYICQTYINYNFKLNPKLIVLYIFQFTHFTHYFPFIGVQSKPSLQFQITNKFSSSRILFVICLLFTVFSFHVHMIRYRFKTSSQLFRFH